jgi:transcriptional regulator with XRE-family HTH domain
MEALTEATGRLGATLRSLRAARSLSLDQAARQVGISRRSLVAFEQGEGNPSLGTLLRVASGYGVGLSDLVGRAEAVPIRVANEADAKTLWRTELGSEARLLVASSELELWSWRLVAGDVRISEPHRLHTKEIVRMEKGSLIVSVADARQKLLAGQVALFSGDRPHLMENRGPGLAVFTLVVHEPVR